jgi:hypothetical protein
MIKGGSQMRKWYKCLFSSTTITGKWLRVLACMSLVLIALSHGMFSVALTRANTVIIPNNFKSHQAIALSNGTTTADSFRRTVTSGWGSADAGGWWTVVGSPWAWSVSPGAGSVTVGANSEEQAYLSSFTIQNVDIVEKVVLPRCSGSSNCDAYVLGRYAPAYSPTYYTVGVMQGVGRADIFLHAQRSDGTNVGSDLDTGLPAANNAVVWLHVQFQGVNPTTLRARAWLDGTTEPSTWLLNTTDNNRAEQQAGMTGVQLRNEDTSALHTFQQQSYQTTGTAIPVNVTHNPSSSTTAHWALRGGRWRGLRL